MLGHLFVKKFGISFTYTNKDGDYLVTLGYDEPQLLNIDYASFIVTLIFVIVSIIFFCKLSSMKKKRLESEHKIFEYVEEILNNDDKE